MPDIDDRRAEQRIPFRVFAALGNTDREWAVHVLDISFHGAKLAILDEFKMNSGDKIQLRLELPKSKIFLAVEPNLHLEGTIAHQKEHILGVRYQPKTEQDAKILNALIAEFRKS
jgi:hypothetical protein